MKKKDDAGRPEKLEPRHQFCSLAFVSILGKEIEGAGCTGLGEELVKVGFKVQPTPDSVHCPCSEYRICHKDG